MSPTTPSSASAPRPTPDAPRAAAPAARRIGAQVLLETRTVLRNGEQLLITLVLPVLLLVVLTRTDLVDVGPGDRMALVAPGILALAVMSTAFTSQAITTGFDRRNGVLRLLATTPLGRGGLVAGKVGAVLVLQAGQVTVLSAVAVTLGWRPEPAGIPAAVLALLLGTAAFTSLALLLAGVLRAEAVLAVANLLWVLLLVGGGVVLPADQLPGPLAALAAWQPAGALGGALRAALTDGAAPAVALLVLTGWAALLGAAATRWFRWD
ncbi:ABC transporter permease [Actinotalea sp.]|uniref:ABC transporter permease n=1 Tax=Actinotalea sp. TaxID=1872145 RepID=UPI002B748144|nr:ABC transporter permease [Actinotalea sp.]HRA51050.1 ABC transporter permease [Actinotalea sp.]